MAKDGMTAGLNSMTGFAANQGSAEGWSWTVDIRSVNGRGLDLRLRLPDWVDGLEADIRKQCQGRMARGTVTLAVRMQRDENAGAMALNPRALEATLDILSDIEAAASAKNLSLGPLNAAEIAGIKGVLDQSDSVVGDVKRLKTEILSSADACLEAFLADRAREGAAISAMIDDQIKRLEALLKQAETAVGNRDAAVRDTMQRAVRRLLDVTEVPDEARLTQELALIAVKNDVTEEIDRLGAHIAAARELMGSREAVGRKFDFLMQEFNREANTLCSKSQSKDLTAIGLDLKALIDQMREQVQNVE